jgi:hypothetical protein
MKIKLSQGQELNLPENPTPEQRKAIALAVIRQTFEDEAHQIGPIELLPKGGWKTTYWVGKQQFQIEYSPKVGFGKRPVGQSNFAESDAPNYRLGDADQICVDCLHCRTAANPDQPWLYCELFDFEVEPSGLCDRWDGGPDFADPVPRIQLSGEVLEDREWEAIANVSEDDIQDAIDTMP